MKFLIILSLLVSQAFASESMNDEEGKLVIRAIRESFVQNDLKCTGDNYNHPASKLNWASVESLYKVTVTKDGSQPVITARHVEGGVDEYVVEFTTNASETLVTHILYEHHKLTTSSTNVGTLSRPRFENVTKKVLFQKITCKK